MATPDTAIHIKMPPAAAAKAKAAAPSPPTPGVVSPKAGSGLDKLVASTAPDGAMIMGEKGPIPAAAPLKIAPGLLPLVIKSPPAAPVVAQTAVQRFPITGSGDINERISALELHVKALWVELQTAISDLTQEA
jgi:hypothetical protein